LITQALYALVFLSRYLDLFDVQIFAQWGFFWNFCFKVFYIVSSLYIIFLMTFVYARTREREKAWKFGMYCLAAALVLAWPMQQIFKKGPSVETSDGRRFLYEHPSTFKEVRHSTL
jgi:ER lumen protein retaining receptor